MTATAPRMLDARVERASRWPYSCAVIVGSTTLARTNIPEHAEIVRRALSRITEDEARAVMLGQVETAAREVA